MREILLQSKILWNLCWYMILTKYSADLESIHSMIQGRVSIVGQTKKSYQSRMQGSIEHTIEYMVIVCRKG